MINITKEDFVKNLTIYQQEWETICGIDDFIEKFADSHVVINPTPAMERLLEITVKGMEDKDDWITWYLFEEVEKKVETEFGDYHINSLEDLYYFMSITTPGCEDEAYYVADHIKELGLMDDPVGESHKVYFYVANNYDELIERYSKDPSLSNLVVELKYLKDAIEKM